MSFFVHESSYIDEDVFMKHVDMAPGASYTDELLIENGTNTKYTLYFKTKELGTFTLHAEEVFVKAFSFTFLSFFERIVTFLRFWQL